MLPSQWWEGGVYENQYVQDEGVWKFQVVNCHCHYHGVYERGWAHTPPNFVPPFSRTFPDDPLGPDALEKPLPALWPNTAVTPFHYPHPVTGKGWTPV